jgi:mRNA interferase RelE/StbE
MGNGIRIKFSTGALKFLDSAPQKDANRIQKKIKFLHNYIVQTNKLPYRETDLKNLSGEWEGFQRLRTGSVRIIFKYSYKEKELLIYGIDYRGNVYK